MHAPQETHSVLVHLADGAGGDDRIVREERQDPARGPVGLVDRFLHELGIVGQPAQVDAVRRELDGSQLHMGFLEEAVRAQGHLEETGYFLRRRGRDDGGSQGEDIGIELELLAQDVVRGGNLENGPAVLRLAGLHLGGSSGS